MDELVHVSSNIEIFSPFESIGQFYHLLFKNPQTPWNPWTFDFANIEHQGIDTDSISHLTFKLKGLVMFLTNKHHKTINGYSIFRSRFHELVVIIFVRNNEITFKTIPTPFFALVLPPVYSDAISGAAQTR